MNVFSRMALAFRALTGDTKTVATMIPSWQEGQPVYPEVKYDVMVKEGWRKNELIYACINKTANTAAQVDLLVKDRGKVLEDHPLKLLINNPNPFMSQFDLWFSVLAYQKLSGWAVFEKERDGYGMPVRLWPLRPDWLHELPSSSNVIRGYKYEPPNLEPKYIRKEDVLAFRLFDPLGIYKHWSPVAVAARIGSVDNATTDFISLFFQQGGTPPGILKTKVKLNDDMVTDIRRRWRERYGGYHHWQEPAVLDSDAEYQKVGSSFQEMGFEVLDARNEARICMVLDVPPIMVSANIGLLRSTFSNYREARLAWWQDSLLPTYSNLEDGLITGLKEDFGDVQTEWDFHRVPALQEERDARWDRAIKAFQSGAVTLNEFCAEVGLPDKGPTGDVFIRQLSQVEVPLRKPRDPIPSPEPVAEPEDETEPEEEPVEEEGKASYPEEVKAAPSYDEERRDIEDRMSGKLEKLLKQQGIEYSRLLRKTYG